jgi:hypothetical protein
MPRDDEAAWEQNKKLLRVYDKMIPDGIDWNTTPVNTLDLHKNGGPIEHRIKIWRNGMVEGLETLWPWRVSGSNNLPFLESEFREHFSNASTRSDLQQATPHLPPKADSQSGLLLHCERSVISAFQAVVKRISKRNAGCSSKEHSPRVLGSSGRTN